MKIILANNKELYPLLVTGAKKTVQGSKRDTLTFIFPESASLEEIDGAFSPENCESVTLCETVQNEDGTATENTYVYKGYTIRAELKKQPEEVTPAAEDTAAVYGSRVMVSMSQRTYVESQLASLTDTVDALVLDALM